MSEQIKPCPFCGGQAYANDDWELWQVECKECKAFGPEKERIEDAIAAWNAAPRPEPKRTCATCDSYERANPCLIFAGARNQTVGIGPDTFCCAEWFSLELRPATGQEAQP